MARVTLILTAASVVLFILAAGAIRLMPADFRGQRFHNAARDGSIPRAQLLLMLGSDIDYMTGIGTALHIAAIRGDTAFMEFLLRRGASPIFPPSLASLHFISPAPVTTQMRSRCYSPTVPTLIRAISIHYDHGYDQGAARVPALLERFADSLPLLPSEPGFMIGDGAISPGNPLLLSRFHGTLT